MAVEFASQDECYEAIGKWLAKDVPEPWIRIEIEFEIIAIDNVCNDLIRYVPKNKPGITRQFFIDDTDFSDYFFSLARLTSTAEKGFFRKCKYVIFSDGRYSCDFEYE